MPSEDSIWQAMQAYLQSGDLKRCSCSLCKLRDRASLQLGFA
jgi:hypothetical protein